MACSLDLSYPTPHRTPRILEPGQVREKRYALFQCRRHCLQTKTKAKTKAESEAGHVWVGPPRQSDPFKRGTDGRSGKEGSRGSEAQEGGGGETG